MSLVLSSPVLVASFTGQLAPSGNSNITGNVNIIHQVIKSIAVSSTSPGIDGVYSDTRIVATGTPDAMDLTPLTGPVGAALTTAKWLGYLLENLSTTAGEILTVGGGTNGIIAAENTDQTIGPGAVKLWFDPKGGKTVTGGSTDIFQVKAAAGTAVSYKVTHFFRSTTG